MERHGQQTKQTQEHEHDDDDDERVRKRHSASHNLNKATKKTLTATTILVMFHLFWW
jgi:hypothetical protein